MSDTVRPMLEPAIIVIFGVTGDLSQRYLLPALYHLFKDDLLDPHTKILGLTRQDMTAEELFDKVELCINEAGNVCDPAALKKIREKTDLLRFDPAVGDDYATLLGRLHDIEDEPGLCMNRRHYLSIPPRLFDSTVAFLGEHGLNKSCQHAGAKTRLLVEKPFG